MLVRDILSSEIAKLAELYALNQLNKCGGAFVRYPPPRLVRNQVEMNTFRQS